jgi:hypothetical protein
LKLIAEYSSSSLPSAYIWSSFIGALARAQLSFRPLTSRAVFAARLSWIRLFLQHRWQYQQNQ